MEEEEEEEEEEPRTGGGENRGRRTDGRTGGEGEEAIEKREDCFVFFEGGEFGFWVSSPSDRFLLSNSPFPRLPLLEYLCLEPLDVELDGCFKRHRRQCLLYL